MNQIIISLFVSISYIIINMIFNKIQNNDIPIKIVVKDSFTVMISTIAACYVYDIFYPTSETLDKIAPVFTDKAPF